MSNQRLQKVSIKSILSKKGGTVPKDRYQSSHEKWKKENMKLYAFRLSRVSEKDMMDFLAQKESVYAYIKGLIREDMEKHKD